jgi:hypothetical protein
MTKCPPSVSRAGVMVSGGGSTAGARRVVSCGRRARGRPRALLRRGRARARPALRTGRRWSAPWVAAAGPAARLAAGWPAAGRAARGLAPRGLTRRAAAGAGLSGEADNASGGRRRRGRWSKGASGALLPQGGIGASEGMRQRPRPADGRQWMKKQCAGGPSSRSARSSLVGRTGSVTVESGSGRAGRCSWSRRSAPSGGRHADAA